MRLTAQIKLQPSPEQADLLKRTLQECNAAADWLSEQAFERKVFRQYALHRLGYHEMRQRFALSAQAAVRAVAKVADAYGLDKRVQRQFRPTGAVAYDARILRYLDDACGHTGHADHIAAGNIASRAAVNRSIATDDCVVGSHDGLVESRPL